MENMWLNRKNELKQVLKEIIFKNVFKVTYIINSLKNKNLGHSMKNKKNWLAKSLCIEDSTNSQWRLKKAKSIVEKCWVREKLCQLQKTG